MDQVRPELQQLAAKGAFSIHALIAGKKPGLKQQRGPVVQIQ